MPTAQTITYTVNPNNVLNPNRGWYKYSKSPSSSGAYSFLSASSLNSTRTTDKCTLLLRIYDLGAFKTTPISQTFLDNIQTDFNTLRASGVKIVLRFRYTELDSVDATKAIILAHIEQLKTITIPNQDVISSVEAGFIGKYGEWYYSNNFGTTNLTSQNLADRNEVAQAIMTLCPNRMVAFRTPKIMQNLVGTTPIASVDAYNGSTKSRVALHNDALLADASDMGTFSNTGTEYPYLEVQSNFTFCGGESNQLNTSYQNPTNALEKLNKFNYSYLNFGYHPDVLAYWKTQGCFDEIEKRIGYRFELVDSDLEGTTLNIKIKNSGFANMFNLRKAYIVFRNSTTSQEYSFEITNTDVRRWTKGQTTTVTVDLNKSIPNGVYNLFLNLPDPDIQNPIQSIQFANTGTWESNTGYNNLLQTFTKGTVESPPPTVTITLNSSNIIIVTGITNFTVQVFNLNGKLVSTSLNISNLRKGYYIVKVTSAGVVYSQKVYKK